MSDETWKRIEQLLTTLVIVGFTTFLEHKSETGTQKQIWSHVAEKEKEIQYVEKVEKIPETVISPTVNTNTVK